MRLRALLLAPLLAAAAPFDPFGAATIVDRPGVAVPIDEAFADDAGGTTTLRRVANGRPILLAPVLHDCPNFCGITLDGLAAAEETAGVTSEDAATVAFGIDPRERPPAAAASLARLRNRHPSLEATALTGHEAAIAHVADALGYRYAFDPRIGQYAHVAAVAVLTPDGRLSRWLYGIAPKPAELRAALAEARAGRTGGIIDRLILLCYHYDPARGRYGLAIERVLAAACVATALLLALYVWIQRRGEAKGC